MFLRRKKQVTKFSSEIGAKKSPRSHPTFTDYDQKRIQGHERNINELQSQIRLLADHLGLVIMKHDRFGTYALVSKEALKSKDPSLTDERPEPSAESER